MLYGPCFQLADLVAQGSGLLIRFITNSSFEISPQLMEIVLLHGNLRFDGGRNWRIRHNL